MLPVKNIGWFAFNRAQFGWLCKMTFSVTTHRQFTSELVGVEGGGRFIFMALFRTLRAASQEYKACQKAEGPYHNDEF